MTHSSKRKQKLRKLKNWRINNPDGKYYCCMCKKPLRNSIHHYFCNKCWKIKEANKTQNNKIKKGDNHV